MARPRFSPTHPICGLDLKFLLDIIDRNRHNDGILDLLCPNEIAFHEDPTIKIKYDNFDAPNLN